VSRPVGVITDRDLVVEVMAAGLDPEAVLVGEVVSEALYSVRESEGVFETMRLMRDHGVRRLPVVGDDCRESSRSTIWSPCWPRK